jgi:hypothetical protein
MAHVLRRRDLLLLIPGALLLPRVTLRGAEGDWPAFRGPGASGVQDDFPLPTRWNADSSAGPAAGVRWKTPIPGLGHSSPIVWGDRVFVATAVRESGEPPLLGLRGVADDPPGSHLPAVRCA